ncbi:MAG TPA: DUF4349 domain-containing protein [Actinomycetota bacterium]|nr:DUF4349 domain-containing protein [Actinomycetota bacterium]
MNTEIEYLQQLEADLLEVSEREAAGLPPATATPGRRRLARTWAKVAGVAAAFLLVAAAIGFFAGGSGVMFEADSGGASGSDGGLGVAQPSPQAPEPSPAPPGQEEPGSQDLTKIIRDGRIGIVVRNGAFGDTVGDLTMIAERNTGFILSSSTNDDRSGTFVLRIPANRFDRARAEIRALGLRVRFEQVTGEDVTAEFIDHEARLRILQERKALLTELSEQADTTEEILQLGNQLDEVQLQIERIQGQLRFLNDQVAESTLRVVIKERSAPAPAAVAVVEKPDLGSSFGLAVQGFLRILSAVIVGLGYLVPIAALGALVWFAIVRIRRHRAVA